MKVAQGRKSLGVVMRARGGIGIRARLLDRRSTKWKSTYFGLGMWRNWHTRTA